jgi:hypothetical protein
MKTAMAAGIALLAATSAWGDQVLVYVDNDDIVIQQVLGHAEIIATKMFGRIGVAVDWRGGKPPRNLPGPHAPIEIQVVSGTPSGYRPGAFAYAELSCRSSRIFVLADRLKTKVSPERVPAVLAHVLVHEITHVLQGVGRHSETGVMKARWEFADYSRMLSKRLEFTQFDIDLIHYRLAAPAPSCAEIQVAAQ